MTDTQRGAGKTPIGVQGAILLVEDDATISELLAYNLRRAGYDVLQETNGRAGLQAALAGVVDLVLLDLMLPGLDGLTVSREIKRRRPDLPVIMLTARSERETMLQGFQAGADDYVTKPFDLDVLLARIEARLRHPDLRDTAEPPGLLTEAPDILDPNAHTLRGRRGTQRLKPKEFELLDLLLSAPGHLFPRDEIVTRVWHHRYLPGSRTLDVHVRRVRDKLATLETGVSIQTVRGVGYRLVLSEEEEKPA
jgi:DNA-binding response OmpR family regulator